MVSFFDNIVYNIQTSLFKRGFNMDEKKAIERIKRQNDYIQKYKVEKYDRINLLLPKGTKERIKASGETMNSFVGRLVEDELERMGL